MTIDVVRYYLQNTKNDFEKAEAHYKRSLEVDGNRVATLCNYAALMKVRARNTSHLTRHTSHQVMKRDAEARGFFLRAQRVNPSHPWVVKNAGVFA